MKDKNKFKVAAILAMVMLFLIYFPTAVVGYFSLGNFNRYLNHSVASLLAPLKAIGAEGCLL